MIKEYKIDLRHQVKSFRKCFFTLALTMAPLLAITFIIEEMDFTTMFVICILFWIVTSVALTIPFHINYLLANWQTKLIVDSDLKTIKLVQSGKTYDYGFSDIQVTRNILGHYRPDRTKSWTPIPFDYYGYLQIRTNDNKKVYLTSLMLDPFKPPLPIDKTEYGFPIIWKQ